MVHKEYVKNIEGIYRVGDTRVSLDSLVHLFREGLSAEGMAENYPALSLEQVHGALAFYLANQIEIDAYLAPNSLYRSITRIRTAFYRVITKLDPFRSNLFRDDTGLNSKSTNL